MPLNWINPKDYSFNSFLLMERFQIRGIHRMREWVEWKTNMGIALYYNPVVKWFFVHKCPECAAFIEEITTDIPNDLSADEIRKSEVFVLAAVEDFVTFTTPEVMDINCHYIRAWDKERLYDMADLNGKVVLDVGSGSGRLAFAAAVLAKEVYASEPVETLREFIRNKARKENVTNIRVVEALLPSIPYPDNTFDIVMSGHVVGDDWDSEIAELTRVCKPGGWLLDCPGDEKPHGKRHEEQDELVKRGWERMYYIGNGGGEVYRYRKQVIKNYH